MPRGGSELATQTATRTGQEPLSKQVRQRAAAAARMRKSRANRAAGDVVIDGYRLPAEGISLLVKLGWLNEEVRHKPGAVRAAFCDVLDIVIATAKITPNDVSDIIERRYAQQPRIG
jgi:hypothetical protein